MERCQANKMDAGASSAGCARKSYESSLSYGWVHCQYVWPVFFALRSARQRRIARVKELSF
jgi:hypothetical protein